MMSKNVQQKFTPLRWSALLATMEAMAVLGILVSIAPDPKNAILLGFSWKRWLMLVFVFAIFYSELNLFLRPGRLEIIAAAYLPGSRLVRRTEIWASLAAVLLWALIWFPVERLGTFLDDYQRLLPVGILVLLIPLQFFVALQFPLKKADWKRIKGRVSANRRLIIGVAITIVLTASLFAFLRVAQIHVDGALPLIFPPSSILTSLQIFSTLALFLFLIYFTRLFSLKWVHNSRWFIILFLVIWAGAFLTWSQTPLTCTDDRPGPYPPNYACYPPINDAVYSIGSFYVGLGEGVHNQWLTDKPLYQVFLAAGQSIFGAEIDHYLLFQIGILALIPAFMFYFSALLFKFSGAPFVAALLVIKGYNEIRLYPFVAGMNVKIENTEGLMTLLIVLLAIFVFRWLQQPQQKHWAVLTGGTLGAGILVRFNPLALVPMILLLIGLAARKQKKHMLTGSVLFVVTLLLTIAPWFLSASNENGVSYYWIKIREVIELRFNSANTAIDNNRAAHLARPIFIPDEQEDSSPSFARDFGVHYLNNVYAALAELPVNFKFYSGESIAKQDLWKIDPRRPVWMADLSTGNLLALMLNLSLVLIGIALSRRRFGLAGLSPLLIQGAYFLGNAAAMTSGERYLLPVSWVTLLYFCVGTMAVSRLAGSLVASRTSPPLFSRERESKSEDLPKPRELSPVALGVMMFAFLLIGASTYLVNFLPEKLPIETSASLQQTTGQQLFESGILSESEWQTFLQNPNAMVIAAKGYHPRFYRSTSYYPGNEFFEVMALGRNYVYVSQMLAVNPQGTFHAGSDVILVGCKVTEDEIWNSKRIIIRANVLLQLNNEHSTYVSGSPDWECARP